MEKHQKALYETPVAEALELKVEGVICESVTASVPATMDGIWGEISL